MIKGKEALLSLKEEYYIENGEHIITFNADDNRLKAIEEDLKDLNLIKEICDDYCIDYNLVNIRNALFTFAQLLGEYGAKWKNYNRKLEAFNIIVKRQIDIKDIIDTTGDYDLFYAYCKGKGYDDFYIPTKEDWKLLKEVLENGRRN